MIYPKYGTTLVLLVGILLSSSWNIVRGVNLDDDLEIDIPDSNIKAATYPTKGKDFDVTIKILKEFNEKLWDKSSEAWNNLRKSIQIAVLGLYVDSDDYQGLHVLEFVNGSIDARLFIRFTKEGKNQLGPLSKALLTGQLGDMSVHNFFVNASNADYEVIQTMLCGIECSTNENCGNDNCMNECCDLAFVQPLNSLPTVHNSMIKTNDIIPNPLITPFNSMAYNQQPVQQFNTPSYKPQDYFLGDSMSSLCGSACSNFCYPLCSQSCCSSLQRSTIPNKYPQNH